MALKKLKLRPAKVSTQVLQRDRHAEVLSALALLATSLEKFAVEIRHLQRTEVRELEEPFTKGQKGSSSMPHKKNPVRCERVSGLARLVRANAGVGLENIALWHERDISHSSAERIIFPDSFILTDFLLADIADIVANWVVHPDRMRANIDATRGLIFSQSVLLALTRKGLVREEAYQIVQRNSLKAWNEGLDFRALVAADPDIARVLGPEEHRALLLARPLTSTRSTTSSKGFSMKVRILVSFKDSVLDPQGQTVKNALHTLGYAAVTDVRQGKVFELELEGGDPEARPRRWSPRSPAGSWPTPSSRSSPGRSSRAMRGPP